MFCSLCEESAKHRRTLVIHRVIHILSKLEPHTPFFMANTRPLRYGGVMNSGFPTPPPGVFDDEPPGWTNNAAAPSAASTHAVKPEPYSPPRMATPTAPAMSETLTQRKREMLKRCTDAAQQLGKPVLFGMTTSLILQSVPLPKDCDLNATELHTVSDSHRTRIRAVVPPTTPHIWKPLSAAHNARINKHVHALNLVHTWAQLAAHMSLESLVILGDATLTAIARKPSLSGGRTADEIYQDFVRQVSELPKFNAKATCMILNLLHRAWILRWNQRPVSQPRNTGFHEP